MRVACPCSNLHTHCIYVFPYWYGNHHRGLLADQRMISVDFSILVLGSGSWPFQQTYTFEIPADLTRAMERFRDFYGHRHNGRKLTWLLPMCRGELVAHCFSRKYQFTVHELVFFGGFCQVYEQGWPSAQLHL